MLRRNQFLGLTFSEMDLDGVTNQLKNINIESQLFELFEKISICE